MGPLIDALAMIAKFNCALLIRICEVDDINGTVLRETLEARFSYFEKLLENLKSNVINILVAKISQKLFWSIRMKLRCFMFRFNNLLFSGFVSSSDMTLQNRSSI